MSTIVTNCVAIAELPAASFTVQVTVVVPVKNVYGASLVTLSTPQLSVVTGVPKSNAETSHVATDEIVIAVGATIVGFTVSTTVTVWLALTVFPLPSITVQVTVVVPIGNVDGALLVTLATVQLSNGTGVPKTTLLAKQPLLVLTVKSDGVVIDGFTSSITVTF